MKQLMENWRKYAKKDTELENLEEGLKNPLVQDVAKWMQGLPLKDAQRLVGLLKAYNEDKPDQVPDSLVAMLNDTPYDLNLTEAITMANDVKRNLQILVLGAALFAAAYTAVGNINQAIDQTASSIEKSIAPSAQLVNPSVEGDFDR